MHVALMTVEGSASSSAPGFPTLPRFGCCAIIATLRSEFFAVVARVGLRFAAELSAAGRSLREGGELGLVSSPDCDRYGLDVKKSRFLGRQGAVR